MLCDILWTLDANWATWWSRKNFFLIKRNLVSFRGIIHKAKKRERKKKILFGQYQTFWSTIYLKHQIALISKGNKCDTQYHTPIPNGPCIYILYPLVLNYKYMYINEVNKKHSHIFTNVFLHGNSFWSVYSSDLYI